MDETTRGKIRKARGKFAAMAGAYSLGVFNDNFFRQSAVLLAGVASKGRIMMLFALPYVLLAPQAGWFADRFSKRRVVIGAKILEVAAMIVGAGGIWLLNWPMILIMTFMMALQSCVFGPALNGSIPELYPPEYVNKANAILKAAVTVCILIGVGVSGAVLSLPGVSPIPNVPAGRFYVGLAVIAISLIGLAVSFHTVRRPAADPHQPFPKKATWEILIRLKEIHRDGLLFAVVLIDTFIWSFGSLMLLVVAAWGQRQFHLSELNISMLTATQLIGVAGGGGLASRLDMTDRWHKVLAPAAAGLGAALLTVGLVPLAGPAARLPILYALMVLAGVAVGLLMIPCESFIQIRPNPQRKGAVIAAANFTIFTGILLSGPAADLLNAHLDPSVSLAIIGGISLVIALASHLALRRFKP
jgi:MFS family permease